MGNLTYSPSAKYVAACGLYCGSCRSFLKEKCPGCKKNEKASWCKIRQCCIENNYVSCADCTIMPFEKCKKFNNFIGQVISVLFRSDRAACIKRIKEIGNDAFAQEMHDKKLQTIKSSYV